MDKYRASAAQLKLLLVCVAVAGCSEGGVVWSMGLHQSATPFFASLEIRSPWFESENNIHSFQNYNFETNLQITRD